ncbi:MAG: ferrochelatase [Nitrospinota bacterium]
MSTAADSGPSGTVAVLLLAFGGPESLNDIEAFLGNILSGRKLSPEALAEITERYRKIGGRSPLSEITAGQAGALEVCLEKKGFPVKVYCGMRYWHPFIKESVKALAAFGHTKVVSLIMAPHYSGYTVKGYRDDLDLALGELGLDLELSFITEWYDNKQFQQAVAEKIEKQISGFKDPGKTAVIFTSHSLPVKFLGPDDPYVKQIRETVDGVVGLLKKPISWNIGFQSKGMIPGEWIGPPVDEILDSLPGEGYKNVLIVPIGFCADHVEVLYDIDIVYRKKAQKLGLNFARTESLNTSSRFIEGLSEVVLGKVRDE